MPGEKGRVLLVDSDHDQRCSVDSWLSSQGWVAQACASPDEAMLMLESDNYNVLITEIQFSGPSGFSFVDWVLSNCPGTLIVVVTSAPFSWVSRLGFMRQVQFCLQRPIKRAALEKTLRALNNEMHGECREQNSS